MFKNNSKNRSHTKNAHVKTLYVLPRLTDQDKTTILEDNNPLNTQDQTILRSEPQPLAQKRAIHSVANFQGELPKAERPKSRFKRIESEHHHFHNPRVQGLLDILKKAQRFELSPDEKKLATFFVTDNKEYGVYGGAVLLKKKVLNAHKNRESRYAFQGEHLWTCSLGLSLPNKDPFLMSGDMVSFVHLFYKELYATLVAFGAEREALFLWVTLDPVEALLLDKVGNFPFILQIKPETTVDGLFHGLLALREDLAIPFLKTRHWGRHLGDKSCLDTPSLNDLSLSASSLRFPSQQEEEMK